MYNRNDEKLGVGLFAEIIGPFQKLTANLEQKILSCLEINDLISFAMLNKTWNRKMTEEIKRRMYCVTVYTWLGGEIPIESYIDNGSGTRGRMGHSALQTYGNSDGEKGIYVSFYPGDCHNTNRTPSCRKSTSHFHTWNQEMSKETKSMAKAIDLYGLNVDAIHQAFHDLHDGNMDSNKDWSKRYNCSDVVLKLLEIGGLYKNIRHDYLSLKTIVPLSILSSNVLATSVNMLFIEICAGFFPNKRITSLGDGIIRLFHLDERRYGNFFYSITRSLTGGLGAMASTYAYSCSALIKSVLPLNEVHKISWNYSLKALFIGASEMLFSRGMRHVLEKYCKIYRPALFPGELISIYGYFASMKLFQILPRKFWFLIGHNWGVRFLLGVPAIFSVMNLAMKVFYDTTITPRYLFEFVRLAREKQITDRKEDNGIFEIVKKNPSGSGIAILAIGAIGFFGYKKLKEINAFEYTKECGLKI